MSKSTHNITCMVCGQLQPARACVPVRAIRTVLVERLEQRMGGAFSADGRVCRSCLNAERTAFVVSELERERGELSQIEAEVSRRAAEHRAIAAHLDAQFARTLTRGERMADRVAAVGGSWPFVIGFALVLATWVVLNSVLLGEGAFDPYPYILLNLALSSLAAIQAPIIMMSQNRSAARDRLEADEDYKINLKAELEIAGLHDKLDHLLHVQWERMAEIQQTQLDLLKELQARMR